MKRVLILVLLLVLSSFAHSAEWYETIRPGAIRSEIRLMAGKPSVSTDAMDSYDRGGGRIECKYDRGTLESVIYWNTPDGALSWSVYSLEGDPKQVDLDQRLKYLHGTNFSDLPYFSGRYLYTYKYRGSCYEVTGGFIVIEPIGDFMSTVGYFADKAAKVLFVDTNSLEKVLYRAAEHWGSLKPSNLTEDQIELRRTKLINARQQVLGMKLADVFGEADSSMGSGVDYRLYYLSDALAVVTCGHTQTKGEVIDAIHFVKPGLTNLTLDAWLR